ncbi:MAG: hypothetical protein K2Q09_00570 [Phycisphaerales bacterium]|nr:hypothetical protein [Phycisphaerales bacterium]
MPILSWTARATMVAAAAALNAFACPGALAQAPANNLRENAQRLNFDGTGHMWMMHFATSEGAIPSTCGGGSSQDVWFVATAQQGEGGPVWARLCYTDWPFVLQVFRTDGAPSPSLGPQVVCRAVPAGGGGSNGVPGCGDEGLVTWTASPGESFLIRLACDPQVYFGGGFTLSTGSGTPATPVTPALSQGPDLVTGDCWGVTNFGTGTVNGVSVRAFGLGADAWNRGTQTVAWVPASPRHPVIAQNIYRDLNGRLDNVGIGWLKHGFASENATRYGPCATPFGDGQTLGPNCSDAYTSTQNGGRDDLGPRFDVNPMTGSFTPDWTPLVGPAPGNTTARRVQVPVSEWATPGAEYWVDTHYVSADDASWGNGRNNVSARRIVSIPTPDTYASTRIFEGGPGDTTKIGQTALEAWAERVSAATPGAVRTAVVDFHELTQPALTLAGTPSGVMKDCYGRFVLYSRVFDNADGTWTYLYGLYNINSHRAAAGVSLRMPPGPAASGFAFKAPLYHSGERIDNSPWLLSAPGDGRLTAAYNPAFPPTMSVANVGTVAAQPNYVYWGTMYTWSFTTAAAPASSQALAAGRLPALRIRLGRGPADATGYQGETVAVPVGSLHQPTVCTADVGRQGGLSGPDGALDNNDFVAFIGAFFAGDALTADLGAQGGLPGADNALDNNDFIVFIGAFFQGCQG